MSLSGLWLGFVAFVPKLIIAVLIFIVGWIIGTLICKALSQVIGALKIDKMLSSLGADAAMSRAGYKLNTGLFIGEIVKWFIVVAFLMTSLEVVGLTQVNDFLKTDILGYLPNVIVAAFILILAAVIADFASKTITAGARAMGGKASMMAGSIAKYAIWISAIIIALSTLGVAPAFMQILFTGIVAMIAIGGGLAFGLGGKEAASRAIERVRDNMSTK